MERITELLKNPNPRSFSIEVSPGVKIEELCNLKHKPLFISVTWHSKSPLYDGLEVIKLAEELAKRNQTVLIHVSCDRLRREYLYKLLEKLKSIDIRNIFAIQGDNFDITSSDFQYSKDLVSHIKARSGDWFCVGVAGYPGCDSAQLQHLKMKQDSGADFVITQAFFDSQLYFDFEKRCRMIGLNIPIIPSILLFENERQLINFAKLCKVKVEKDLCEYLRQGGQDAGMKVMIKIVKEISERNKIHFHLFSLNTFTHVSNFIDIISNST